VIRPGPPWLERGECPGGLVLMIYAATDPPRLLLTSKINMYNAQDRAEADRAIVDALIGEHERLCIVVYDGDTGERMPNTARVFDDSRIIPG
jgi:hypothetical protein